MEFRRHDLVMADWPEEMVSAIPHEGLRRLVKSGRVPGIVRRDEGCDDGLGREYYTQEDTIPLGFVHPFREHGARVRHAAHVEGRHALRVTTPYEVTGFPFEERTPALAALLDISATYSVGAWGSTALEIVSGLPYTDARSDLDLLVTGYDAEELCALSGELIRFEQVHGVRIDVEITLKNGYGINIKEYASSSKELLGKGLQDVILIKRDAVDALL
jgi:phosphoribosyl-dephospho-CoA transferase